jgi:hypothetical protein
LLTDKQILYKDVAKLAVNGTNKCFRTRENVLLTLKLLLIWISDKQAKGDKVNPTLIRLRGFSAIKRLVFIGVYLPEK